MAEGALLGKLVCSTIKGIGPDENMIVGDTCAKWRGFLRRILYYGSVSRRGDSLGAAEFFDGGCERESVAERVAGC